MIVKPNTKEISRACNGWTTVVRPDKVRGGWNVCIVSVETGRVLFGKMVHCETKEEVSKLLKEELRTMHTLAFPCDMAMNSRHRNYCSPGKKLQSKG